MTTTLNLDAFKLFQTTFEIRYDEAYLLWDKSGEIWSNVSREWPNLKIHKAEPNNTTLSVDNFQLSATIDKSNIIDLKPSSSLSEFTTRTDKFIKIISNTLKIREYSRLGFRLIYVKKYTDKESAAKALLDLKLFKYPTSKCFNIDGKLLQPRYGYNYEDDSSSVRIAIEARETKVDVDSHPGIEELSPLHLVKHELVYDIDYSTVGKVYIGQLDVKEWISQVYHLIKRDSNKILGGL